MRTLYRFWKGLQTAPVASVIDIVWLGCMLFSVCTLFFWEKVVDIFNLPFVRQLSDEEVSCLINCHSYEKYYFYRKCYEADTCPLCVLPESVYPTLTDTEGKQRRKYTNIHWTTVIDTFAEKEGRAETLLMVRSEHLDARNEQSLISATTKMDLMMKVDRYLDSHFGDTYGTWISHRGTKSHTIDPVRGHANSIFIIPDETIDVRYPIFKGPARRKEIEERALGFAVRFESGEIPERFKAAP